MSILKKENVISLIYETVRKSYLNEQPSTEDDDLDDLDDLEDTNSEDTEDDDTTSTPKRVSRGSQKLTRTARFKVIDKETKKMVDKDVDWSQHRPESKYVGSETNLIGALKKPFGIKRNDSDYPARQAAKKLRVLVRQKKIPPEDALAKYGIFRDTYGGDYDNLIQQLTSPLIVRQNYAIWFYNETQRTVPAAFVRNESGISGKGNEEIYVPITGSTHIYKKENYDGLMELARRIGSNPIFIEILEKEIDKKTKKETIHKIRPTSVPRGEKTTIVGTFGYPTLEELILRTNSGYTEDEINDIINTLKQEVKNGATPREVLVKYNLISPDTNIDKYTEAILRGEAHVSAFYKTTGEVNFSKTLKGKLLNELRDMFGIVTRDDFDDTNIKFEKKTYVRGGASRGIKNTVETNGKRYYELMKQKLIPPIVLSSKYIDRRSFKVNNDNLEIRGHSYHYYTSLYEFLMACTGDPEVINNLKTYYLTRIYNKVTKNYEPIRAGKKIETVKPEIKQPKTSIYRLSTLNYEEPNFNVLVRNDWEISGKRENKNYFKWTFKINLSLGKKMPDDEEVYGGLINLDELNNYFNQEIQAEETVDNSANFLASVSRKLTHRKNKTEISGQTILDDGGVKNGLKRVIEYVMDKIENNFHPEEAFANFANVEVSDLVDAFNNMDINRVINPEQPQQPIQESFDINIIVQRIMNNINKRY